VQRQTSALKARFDRAPFTTRNGGLQTADQRKRRFASFASYGAPREIAAPCVIDSDTFIESIALVS